MSQSENLEKASELADQARKAQQELAPVAAKVVVGAVESKTATDDLLQLIGIVSGQGIKAEDLLQAIRDELKANR